MVIEMHFA